MSLVGIVAKITHPQAAEGVVSLTSWLAGRGVDYLIDRRSAEAAGLTSTLERADVARRAGLIVVLGGDGTMISVARLMEGAAAPLLGVNLGSLGFLTEFTYEEMIPALEMALAGKMRFEDRIMLRLHTEERGKPGETHTALNDIVIHRGPHSQMVDLDVEVDGVFLNSYTADGLILATPTGSTAYNLSSGGPIVYPSLNAIIISPICPHTLSNRPIVIPDGVEVTVALSATARGEAAVTLDGQVALAMAPGVRLRIRKAREVTRIIQSPYNNYYELLRGKLKWGERLRGRTP